MTLIQGKGYRIVITATSEEYQGTYLHAGRMYTDHDAPALVFRPLADKKNSHRQMRFIEEFITVEDL